MLIFVYETSKPYSNDEDPYKYSLTKAEDSWATGSRLQEFEFLSACLNCCW